jgi:hypothetical protein
VLLARLDVARGLLAKNYFRNIAIEKGTFHVEMVDDPIFLSSKGD